MQHSSDNSLLTVVEEVFKSINTERSWSGNELIDYQGEEGYISDERMVFPNRNLVRS